MVTFEIDMSPLLNKLASMSTMVHQPMKQLVNEQARLIVSSSGNVPGMVQVIPPGSQGKRGSEAKQQGERAVRRDIAKVYTTPGKAYEEIKKNDLNAAKAFWIAVKGKSYKTKKGKTRRGATNMAEAQRLLRVFGGPLKGVLLQPFDDGVLHMAARNSRGRVPGKANAKLVVANPRALKKYVKERMDNVGTLASSFNLAGWELGAKGIPAWILRHGMRFSGFHIEEDEESFYVEMTALIPFGKSEITGRIPYVLEYRRQAIIRQWPYIVQHVMNNWSVG